MTEGETNGTCSAICVCRLQKCSNKACFNTLYNEHVQGDGCVWRVGVCFVYALWVCLIFCSVRCVAERVIGHLVRVALQFLPRVFVDAHAYTHLRAGYRGLVGLESPRRVLILAVWGKQLSFPKPRLCAGCFNRSCFTNQQLPYLKHC